MRRRRMSPGRGAAGGGLRRAARDRDELLVHAGGARSGRATRTLQLGVALDVGPQGRSSSSGALRDAVARAPNGPCAPPRRRLAAGRRQRALAGELSRGELGAGRAGDQHRARQEVSAQHAVRGWYMREGTGRQAGQADCSARRRPTQPADGPQESCVSTSATALDSAGSARQALPSRAPRGAQLAAATARQSAASHR